MDTLLLRPDSWDLTLDISGNIAVATNPYSLAQNAASVIKTFLGEVWYNTTAGVAWDNFLGQAPNLPLLRANLIAAALTVPDVASAKVFFSQVNGRIINGQVQVTSTSGVTSAAAF